VPLVGRGEELDLLSRRWAQAKDNDGRVVLLSGEPGIGKSRLIAALLEKVESEDATCMRYFCLPHHQGSALQPIVAQLSHAAGFDQVLAKSALAERIGDLVAQLADTPEA